MAKHRHHHHHSKSPSRRPPSPEGQHHSRALFQGDPSRGTGAGTNRKPDNNSVARHRHRSTPPRAEISRRRSVEEENAFNTSLHAPALASHQLDANAPFQMRQYMPLVETFHRNSMGDFGTAPPPVSGYDLPDRRLVVGSNNLHHGRDNQYDQTVGPPAYTTVRNRQASIHAYEGTGVDPRTHLMLPARPHRKYYITKRDKGCLGPCNTACCCGAFDRDTGLCGYLNCCGCCDRETKLLKRIGSFSESDNIRKRVNPAWCGGCCCAY
eukprot:Gregarina_sp_Poly_1__6384@NODE_3400_length_1122_cov_83_984834_g2149_i0_p1_GENE_NODE_3400_length_1122_cov_83_984834_g2149_i0NODE_3400_length_1122_cov_83_984834_g2149_i0_p1_ORF_typecomplete_len267_score26_90_NODE_3400_length_1122_cov_83_984834_g2149_i0162962